MLLEKQGDMKYENKKEIAAWDKLSKGQKLTQPKKESKIEEKAAPQE